MLVLAWIILLVAAVVGPFLLLLGIPGQFLLPLCAGAAWLLVTPPPFSGTAILVLFAIAFGTELLEVLLGAWGGRRAGGSRGSAWGAILGGLFGGIVGTAVLPVVGSIIGVLAGTFVGATAIELTRTRRGTDSLRVGYGALKGRVLAILLKGTVALGFLAFAAYSAWVGLHGP